MKNFYHNWKITFVDDGGREGLEYLSRSFLVNPKLGAAMQTIAYRTLFKILDTIVQAECESEQVWKRAFHLPHQHHGPCFNRIPEGTQFNQPSTSKLEKRSNCFLQMQHQIKHQKVTTKPKEWWHAVMKTKIQERMRMWSPCGNLTGCSMDISRSGALGSPGLARDVVTGAGGCCESGAPRGFGG